MSVIPTHTLTAFFVRSFDTFPIRMPSTPDQWPDILLEIHILISQGLLFWTFIKNLQKMKLRMRDIAE
jgi:hypothetical protein